MPQQGARLNIYFDPPELRDIVRAVALRSGETASAWCVEAIVRRLLAEGHDVPVPDRARAAADTLDRLRASLGPLGMSVRELIEEGRRR